MRVLIVGAGPTGLTAAVELARRGTVPDVIDRKQEASALSRAVGILPRSLELLAPSGVTDRLLAEGVKLRQVQVFVRRRRVMNLSLAGGHPGRDFGLALAQDRTEAALRDALVQLGGTVHYGTELASLRQEDGRVVVQTGDSAEAVYDYLVGADGVNSTTRKSLGLEFQGHDLPETWSIADVDVANWPRRDALTICMTGSGSVVVVAPLEPERYRVISNTEDALATLPLDIEVTSVRRQGQFRIAIRQVAQYGVERVFLAGDAAHCHSPAGGRGMNLGIADAAELASRMVEGRLDGYTASRHVEGAKTIATSEQLRGWLTSSNPIVRAAVVAGCGMIHIVPFLQRRFARRFLGD